MVKAGDDLIDSAAVEKLSVAFKALTSEDLYVTDRRVEFEKSQEGSKASRLKRSLYACSLGISCGGVILTVLSVWVIHWAIGVSASVLSIAVIVSVTLMTIGRYQYSQHFKVFVPALADEARAERRREMEDISLPAMLKFNRDQMVLYHTIATTQAKVAGRNSQLAIAVGFVVLSLGASVAVLSSDLVTKVVTASLASLGGIFSAYITRTFFVAQDRAIRQLYDYWQQPLASSYLLAAERIANEALSPAFRDEQFAKIIARILEVSGHYADRTGAALSSLPSNQSATRDGAQTATETGATND